MLHVHEIVEDVLLVGQLAADCQEVAQGMALDLHAVLDHLKPNLGRIAAGFCLVALFRRDFGLELNFGLKRWDSIVAFFNRELVEK